MVEQVKQLKAQHNYVLVRIDTPEEYETGSFGITVPTTAQSWEVTGEVLSKGPTCRLRGLVPGDRVLFSPYGVGDRLRYAQQNIIALLDFEVIGLLR